MASTSHSRAYTDLLGYLVIFAVAMDVATASIPATCGRELGMKNNDIRNDQITASSTYQLAGQDPWSAFYARIGNRYAWYPSVDNKNQWLQVDLRKQMVITGVQTQGHYTRAFGSYYVETFKLQFKTDETSSSWLDAFDGKEFEGNNGANRIKHNNFTTPVVASAIRFLPLTWHEGIALRVEILGCDLSDITCREPPTITNTLITTSSSSDSFGAWRKYECAAGFTSPAPDYDLICGINGAWYWTNGAPDCTRIPTTRSTQLPISTVPLVKITTESTAGIAAGLSSNIIPIAAGVGGGLVLLVVIIIIVVVCRRKRQGRSDTVKLEDLSGPRAPTSTGAEERPEEVSMVRNDLYEWEDGTGSTGSRQGEHPEEVGFVRNDVYESVNRTGDESSNVTLLPAHEGTAALYTAVNKNRQGADDTGMVENIIYETRN
ncbi:PREDICTED: discoidin, CUB and LCCL domain-containing protein 2-like [Branchiostoma belcheri]|uniref:Discoidin, CUB and LCCL domain-containing protein 2-like n=1 Tax=Branchiostoma belcheri TaxID=7741 RepID=A0A6P4Z641_BRABE|nr:PREDICTED: discoidin, CUB and LCCL domain-containing protein 2-like [Branchiostoma belcheri]